MIYDCLKFKTILKTPRKKRFRVKINIESDVCYKTTCTAAFPVVIGCHIQSYDCLKFKTILINTQKRADNYYKSRLRAYDHEYIRYHDYQLSRLVIVYDK